MKVLTDLSKVTVQLAIFCALAAIACWKIASCVEVTAQAKAQTLQQTCPQELTVLRKRFEEQTKDMGDLCDAKLVNNCQDIKADLKIVKSARDKYGDSWKECQESLINTKKTCDSQIEQMKKDRAEEIQRLVTSLGNRSSEGTP